MKKAKNEGRAFYVVIAIVVALTLGLAAIEVMMFFGKRANPPAVPDIGTSVISGIITGNPETAAVTAPDTTPVSTPVTDAPDTGDDPIETTAPFNPGDPVGNGDVAPDEIPEDTQITVRQTEVKTEIKEEVTEPAAPAVTEIKTTEDKKEPDDEKPASVSVEVINDIVIGKKEEAEKKKEEKDPEITAPATVIDSASETIDEPKPVTVITEIIEQKDDPVQNGNAPVFVNPAQGGPNPFEEGNKTQVEDHNSEEYVGEGGDRPGEGIHF
jgi:hypothetical protein